MHLLSPLCFHSLLFYIRSLNLEYLIFLSLSIALKQDYITLELENRVLKIKRYKFSSLKIPKMFIRYQNIGDLNDTELQQSKLIRNT